MISQTEPKTTENAPASKNPNAPQNGSAMVAAISDSLRTVRMSAGYHRRG